MLYLRYLKVVKKQDSPNFKSSFKSIEELAEDIQVLLDNGHYEIDTVY